MKKILPLFFSIAATCSISAQKAGELKTFKDKKVKLNINNFYKVNPTGDDGFEVYSVNKKGNAEVLKLDNKFSFVSVNDASFDADDDLNKITKKKYGDDTYMDYTGLAPVLVLQDNVLEPGTKALGINMSSYTLKSGLNLATGYNLQLRKGRIVKYYSSYNYGTYGSGSSVNTEFQSQQEIKFKSAEDKNVSYEFHKASGEEFRFRSGQETDMTIYQKSGTEATLLYSTMYSDVYKVYDTYTSNKRNVTSYGMIQRSLIRNSTGNMLMVARRHPIYKFGQRPTAEEWLQFYYIYKVDVNTLDVVAELTYQEPFSRDIIFRQSLFTNGGILLISAPTKFAGDKVTPKAESPTKYVFRHITDDPKMDWQTEFDVPSGFTHFMNAVETPDSTIILYGIVDTDKKDNFYNKKIGLDCDAFFTMVIKGGKIMGIHTVSIDDMNKNFKIPAGIEAQAKFNPSKQSFQLMQTRILNDGSVLLMGNAFVYDGKELRNKVEARLALQISPEGKMINTFWIPSETDVEPATAQMAIRTGEDEFLWLTYDTPTKNGGLMRPVLVKLNTAAGSISAAVRVADEKHFVTSKCPAMIDLGSKEMKFFGFDKGGKEFWYQPVTLE